MYNNIERKVYNFIQEKSLIVENDHVIVGVSGGADSTCLLYLLNKLSKRLNLKLTAIHINHMIRGDEALRDERHVVDFCRELNIDIIVERIDVIKLAKDRKISTEEAGRNARYSTFYKYKDKLGAQKIAVAHNKNDNVETVIMNIVRGSGLDGLGGIDAQRDVIVRPIITLSRDEIEKYCQLEDLDYVVDSTNCEVIYTRNKVRLKLIKEIDDMFDVDIVSKIDRMSYLVREDNSFIEGVVEEKFDECVIETNDSSVLLDVEKLRLLHKAIQRRVLRRAIVKVNKVINKIEYKHIEDMLKLICVNKSGLWLDLPQGIGAYRDYNRLKICKKPKKEVIENKEIDIDILVGDTKIQIDDRWVLEIEVLDLGQEKKVNDAYTKYFDYDILSEGLKLRQRRNGDKFRPINFNGTKKLKKYFIDKKISKPERDKMYLLAKGSEIIWIIGENVSEKFRVTKYSKKIVRFTLASVI
ncbi:MAG: tRNA lysidine(34) synthetase TilS [Clostridiales bacterium]|nr:tRNA lysidine(34) synthetase TilS [Clostridiales bacterium]